MELFYAVYSVCTLEINCSWYAVIGHVSSTYRIICNKRRAYSNREATDFSLFSTMVLLLNKGRMRKTVTRFVKTGLRMVRRSKRKILRDRCDYAKHCARETERKDRDMINGQNERELFSVTLLFNEQQNDKIVRYSELTFRRLAVEIRILNSFFRHARPLNRDQRIIKAFSYPTICSTRPDVRWLYQRLNVHADTEKTRRNADCTRR